MSFAKTPSDSVVLKQVSNDDSAPEFQAHKSQRLQRKAERQSSGAAVAGQKRKQPDDADGTTKKTAPPPQLPDEYLPPNPILFIQNLPSTDVGREVLETLFSPFDGLQDVRMIPGRDIAFVEFNGANEAARARESLNGRKVHESDKQGMRITFARAS